MCTDITDIAAATTKSGVFMKHYIEHLRKITTETLPMPKHTSSKNRSDRESLETQIKRWWASLPPILQQRRFQIVEIANQCRGRFRDKPALREVANALRSAGWQETRDWTNRGRNQRLWIPPK